MKGKWNEQKISTRLDKKRATNFPFCKAGKLDCPEAFQERLLQREGAIVWFTKPEAETFDPWTSTICSGMRKRFPYASRMDCLC